MRVICVILSLTFSSIVNATDYYIKTGGNNNSDGRTDATAWATISKLNSTTFSPGDVIHFRNGDTWREILNVPSSGNSSNYITFTKYGTGSNPRILGSTQAANWTETASGSHIWKSATTFASNPWSSGQISEIFFENSNGTQSWGTYKTSMTGLTAEFQWTWASSAIYVYALSDPGTRYKSVEVPVRESGVNMNKKNYIHFDGIDILYTEWSGYGYDRTHNDMYEQFGLIIENSEIGCMGAWEVDVEQGYGIEVVYTDMVIRNNKLHDCGRRNIAMDIYGNGYTARNILVELNEMYNGFHTTGCDIDVGAGGYTGNLDNVIIRRNYIHENKSRTDLTNLIFIQNNNVGVATLSNVYIYSNIFQNQNGYGILMEGVQSVYIYNNTFYEKASACPTWAAFVASQSNSHATIKNNIFFGGVSGTYGDAIDDSSPFTVHDYNLFYNLSSESEAHGQMSKNPLFLSTTDYHLQPASPAINTGITVTGVTMDYEGTAFGNPPNIGAYTSAGTVTNPVFVSSAIEIATPSTIDITYSLALANIIPATSAFTVQVNGTARTVSSVVISGTKVSLTLSSPVVGGDVVTVAYTTPATNPLQTSAGGQASTISAQPVTNKITAPAPVYVGSAIENATPSVIDITYSLALANIIPATSAFTVRVNSTARTVSSVIISGTKVSLTLSSPVVAGDVVTVAYTKPATNPLQTSAGGQATTFAAQAVTNKLAEKNSPPVIVVSYKSSIYSRFVGVLDASLSYDPDNDPLKFEWITPANIEVSSKSNPRLRFLAPVVYNTVILTFTLNVTDGKSVTTRDYSVTILPYKFNYSKAKVKSTFVSSSKSLDGPDNVIDENLTTIWSSDEINQYLVLELEESIEVSYFELAFKEGDIMEQYFDIYGSKDNFSWEPILIHATSAEFASGYQIFELPEAKTGSDYTFIKLIGQGNSTNSLNKVSEFNIYGTAKISELKLILYPNPAHDNLNVSIEYPGISRAESLELVSHYIKIYDITGVQVYEKALETGVSFLQIPLELKTGVYFVELVSGVKLRSVSKFVVY